MRKLMTLLLSAILFAVTSGCSKEEEDNWLKPGYLSYYNIDMFFVSESGANLVDRFPCEGPRNEMSKLDYKMEFSAKVNKVLFDEPLIGNEQDKGEYIIINMASPEEGSNTVTIGFTSRYIFGNDDRHNIVTDWERYDEKNSFRCSVLKYDGKEFPVRFNPNTRRNEVTIVVDREK